MKKRFFKDFVAELGDDGIRTIAIEYATEDDCVTVAEVAKRHNISVGITKKIFEYAIVNCLVSYQIAILMKAKAHRNQSRHISKKSDKTSSDKYYDNLFSKRLDTVKRFPTDRVKEVVDMYLDSRNLSAKEVGLSVGLSKKEVNIVISKAIIFNIVDDETVYKLNQQALYRVLSRNERIIVSEILNQYKQLRVFYTSLILKIEALKFRLRSYEDFVSSEDNLDDLRADTEKELKKANKSLEEFKTSFFK